MKKTYFNIIGLFIAVTILFSACDQWIDPDINIDPDSPEQVPLANLLPAVSARTAYNVGGFDLAGTTSMWMQYVVGGSRQAAIIGEYTFVESDVVNMWNFFYRDAMMDIHLMIQQANESASPHVEGVAKIMMAYNLGTAAHLWGSVPYREAFKGSENLHPAYDSQQQVYDDVQTLLADAITLLQSEENVYAIDGDLFYGGDRTAWIKAARVLQARYAIHLSKRNGTTAYQNALNFLSAGDGGFASSDEDMIFPFGSADQEANPLWQYDDQRGDCSQSGFFQNLVQTYTGASAGTDISMPSGTITTPDPRATPYFDGGTFGTYYGSKNSPVPFVTYVEQLFIKAEAQCETNAKTDARQTLKDAVAASLAMYGVTDDTWLTDYYGRVDALADGDLFEEIMLQKYIAMFLQPEAYSDWRRTGIPNIQPTTGSTIPKRFPYSTEERLYNKSIPALTDIFVPNWKDE